MDSEELEIASRNVRPLFGYSFFTVSKESFDYYIVFEYEDPLKYYLAIMDNEELYEEEIERLHQNMQNILDQEITKFNDDIIKPKVIFVDIGLKETVDRPYILFRVSTNIRLRPGRNIYENIYEAAIAEYDYVSYWSFPKKTKIEYVEIDGTWEIEDSTLVIYVKKGSRIRGREKIIFTLA
ncbi:MAG: hypothetical protein ACP5GI_03645 [Sulfolobales archaeon]